MRHNVRNKKNLNKNLNKNLMIKLLLQHESLTRMEIHEITDIRLATITELARELIDEGWLCEGGNGSEDKKKVLRLNLDRFSTVGIDIQPDQILALFAEPSGRIVRRMSAPIAADAPSDLILERVLHTLDEIMAAAAPIGIGVSITGFIDKEKTMVLASSQMQNFSNIPISKIIGEKYHLPVIVDDSASLNLICERRFAKGERSDDIIYVEIGYGVGTGILANGSLVKGYSGLAGELGHSIVDPHGKLCVCGNRGCLRTVATSTEVVRRVTDLIRGGTYSLIYEMVGGDIDSINIDTVLRAAMRNDKVALNVTDETAMYIGIALSNAVNMLNPRELIFGGQMFRYNDYMLEPIKRIISKNILPMFANGVLYKVGQYIGDGGALGACVMMLDRFCSTLFLD